MAEMICSECGNPSPVWDGYSLPTNGFYFAPREFGYYAGFSDNTPWREPTKEEQVFFCHNCCVRLLDSFPSIARAIGDGGHHPCNGDVPCCAYAWRGTENFGKNHDQELVRTQHPVRDEATGMLKWQDDAPEKGYN